MAAPFEQAFDEFEQLRDEAAKYTSESAPQGIREGGEVRAIHYREEEAIFIKASHDRVTVIFSTIFRDETDKVFAKVFLQVPQLTSTCHFALCLFPDNCIGIRRCPKARHSECPTSPLQK